jgi:hypothetical protein
MAFLFTQLANAGPTLHIRKTIDSHRNAHHRAWRETGFCGGHYVDYERRPS